MQPWKFIWLIMTFKSAADHTESPEFAALVALGPKITPLVVQKLTQPSDLFAVELYNRLDIKRPDEVNRQDLLNYKVIQRQANSIPDLNSGRRFKVLLNPMIVLLSSLSPLLQYLHSLLLIG